MSHNSVIAGVISSQRGGGVGGGGGVPVVQGSGLHLVRDKDTSIVLELTTPGSGSNRILLGKLGPDLPDPPQTGVVYTPSLVFGSGDEINIGTFVLATGNVSNWEVTGLPSDTEVTFVSYEFNSSGSQYLVSVGDNNLTTRTAVIYDDVFVTGSGDPPGKTDLETNSKFYYDFSLLTGSDGSTIVGGNPGLNDEGPGTNTLSPLNSPQVRDISIGGGTTKTLRSFGTACVDTGVSGNSFFQSDFEIYLYFQTEDGIPSSPIYFCGTTATTGSSIFSIIIDSGGKLLIRYKTPGQDSRWDSTSALLSDGANIEHILRIKYDFSGNAHGVWLDGSPVSGSFISGNITALDPATFNSNVNFKIGSHDFFGIQNNATVTSIIRMACTGLKSDQEAADIEAYLTFQASSGSTLQDYTIQEVAGFDQEVIGNELILSGDPLGFRDWVSHEFVLPANLEHFEVEIGLRINEAPDTTSTGIGLGIRNDLTAEANRAAVMEFITDTDSNNFGKVQLYTGNGTISETAFSFRSQSSTILAPALNNEYVLTLTREPQTNDAVYTGSIAGVSEEQEITTAYTEIGRPSSEFFGDTMRTWIHQNAGGHAITYFLIRRLGTEVTPPPPGTFDVYVTTTGSDTTGDGSATAPYRTHVKAFEEIAALGGSNRSLSTGAGIYLEDSFLNPPPNLGLWQGAGSGVTTIGGTSALNSFTNRSSQSGFLISLISASSTSVTTDIRGITLDGHRAFVNDPDSIKGGIAVRNRHGVKMSDVVIQNFNTCAIRMGDVDEFTLENFVIRNSSGRPTGGGFTYYQIETWNVGGAIQPDGTNFKIIFKDGTIDAMMDDDGAGWGIVGGGTTDITKYITNVEWNNVSFSIGKTGSPIFNGHHFNIEGLYMSVGNMYIHDCTFNNNLSWGGLGALTSSLGKTRIYNCTFNLEPDAPTFVIEMQISNIEIDHNFIRGAKNGVFVSLNDQDTFGNPAFASITRGDHGNWYIHHNIVECGTAAGYGLFGGANWELHGVVVEHNTWVFTTTSGGIWYGMFTDNNAGSVSTGLVIRNNAYVGVPATGAAMWDTGGQSGGVCQNNKSGRIGSTGNPFPVTQTRSGVTSTNNQVHNSGSNTLGLTLGTPPTTRDQAFNGNYYRPSATSVLKGAGHDGSDIGALTAL